MTKNKNQTINEFVSEWNKKFPLDRWYRKKYNIRFGSLEHRSISMFHVLFEYNEDRLYNNIYKELDNNSNNKYKIGDFIKSRDNYKDLSNEDLSKLIFNK